MPRRSSNAQKGVNMDHVRQLQGQLREHIKDKANLLSENKDLAYALNITRSELAAAKKTTVELQMTQIRQGVQEKTVVQKPEAVDVGIQCNYENELPCTPISRSSAAKTNDTTLDGEDEHLETSRQKIQQHQKVRKTKNSLPRRWRPGVRSSPSHFKTKPASRRIYLNQKNVASPPSHSPQEIESNQRPMRQRNLKPLYTFNLSKKMRKGDPVSFQIY